MKINQIILGLFICLTIFSCSTEDTIETDTSNVETNSADFIGYKYDISKQHAKNDLVQLRSIPSDFQLEVALSRDGSNYEDTICLRPNMGYSIRLLNSNFTGFLEVRAKNPYTNNEWRTQKWYWVENGFAQFPDELLEGLGSGYYYAQFRFWIPNGSNLPWSNLTTVIIHPWLCG